MMCTGSSSLGARSGDATQVAKESPATTPDSQPVKPAHLAVCLSSGRGEQGGVGRPPEAQGPAPPPNRSELGRLGFDLLAADSAPELRNAYRRGYLAGRAAQADLTCQRMRMGDWIWHGKAGHFICAPSCCFKLHTTVGRWRISTVGCYHPAGAEDDTPNEVGSGRLYETMVFENGPDGEPVEWCEIDSDAYQSDEDAQAGHIAMCRKWSAR